LSRGGGSAWRRNACSAVVLAAAAASGQLEQDLGEASDRECSEGNQRTRVDCGYDVANYGELRLRAQVHGIRISKKNGHDAIVIAKRGVGLGAIQLIVAEGDNRARGKRAAEAQASILLENILLHSDNVGDAVGSHFE
jgi:hypothetical protein